MKLSLFLLITAIIFLAFAQNSSSKSTSKALPNQVENIVLSLDNEPTSNGATPIVLEENEEENSSPIWNEEDTEAYLDFVRKQMRESVQENLENIQEILREESVEQAERLILM